MGTGSPRIQYQVIAPKSDVPGEYDQFVIGGVNRQIDWRNVTVGQIVHIALNEDVRPPTVQAPKRRIIAPYVKKVIVAHEVCTSCAHDTDADDQTICPECIESWCWDWFVRFERNWTSHGTYASYSAYGCRCPECRIANKRASLVRNGREVAPDRVLTVRTLRAFPRGNWQERGN